MNILSVLKEINLEINAFPSWQILFYTVQKGARLNEVLPKVVMKELIFEGQLYVFSSIASAPFEINA